MTGLCEVREVLAEARYFINETIGLKNVAPIRESIARPLVRKCDLALEELQRLMAVVGSKEKP